MNKKALEKPRKVKRELLDKLDPLEKIVANLFIQQHKWEVID